MARQYQSSQEWLPPGWFIAASYWDIESGGLDIEARGHGTAYLDADVQVPRDGGLADLLAEAAPPLPRFAAVICEDIERSGRDTFNALKLEKELARAGVPLFATDEPADIAGANATTVLVRRVKQGVAEWFRRQIKEKSWKGLKEHSLAGWNIGSPPYGYATDRIPPPVPFKAAQGRTKTRFMLDPERAPSPPPSTRGEPRTSSASTPSPPGSMPTPPPARRPRRAAGSPAASGPSWATPSTPGTWCSAAAAPPAARPGQRPRSNGYGHSSPPTPPSSAAPPGTPPRPPAHSTPPAVTAPSRAPTQRPAVPTSCAAGSGAGHASTGSGRYYTGAPDPEYTYYACRHNPARSRPATAVGHPRTISGREEHLLEEIRRFYAERIFGPDRAALLAAQIPATAAQDTVRRQKETDRLSKRLHQIDAAENAHAREIEALGHQDGNAAAITALRSRLIARFTELETDRAAIGTRLAELAATTSQDADPSLLDALPNLGDILHQAPARLQQQLYQAFGLELLYKHDIHQVTIYATITSTTPATIAAIIADSDTPGHATASTGNQPEFSHLMRHPI